MLSLDVKSRFDVRFIGAPISEGVHPLSEWRGKLSNLRGSEKRLGGTRNSVAMGNVIVNRELTHCFDGRNFSEIFGEKSSCSILSHPVLRGPCVRTRSNGPNRAGCGRHC